MDKSVPWALSVDLVDGAPVVLALWHVAVDIAVVNPLYGIH